ncbi:hypothetical protein GN958_ATG14763 [Phytophthora infestans]|uniref:Uncharacterized protein n=1 Tax=Phytophthora infestans TaxID=4787 RepID=A0A8S9U974_PHYIN|nr:hypothetical protein GN958_ATG14763 [Phytophthora infestans]
MPIKAPHGSIISAEPPHGASTDTQPPQGAATEPVSPHAMLGRRMASPSATSNRVPPRLQRQSTLGAPGAPLVPQLTQNYITGARRQLTVTYTCRAPAHQSLKRPPPSIAATQALVVQAETRAHL